MKPLEKVSLKHPLQLHKNICVDFMKAYQDQKVEEMVRLCGSKSTIWFKPLGDSGKGKIHELGKGLWTTLIDCFPNIDNTVHSIISESGKIKCVVSIRGTQEKDFAGIQSQGGSFDSEHIFVFRLNEKENIQHIDIEWDHADFVSQLSRG
jgi:hypothetical protein